MFSPSKWISYFSASFLCILIGDLTYGIVTYILRIPSPREYLPLVHEVPYMFFAWFLALSSFDRALGGLRKTEKRHVVLIIIALSSAFLVCSYKMVLDPFFHDNLRRPFVMYFTSTSYAVGQSVSVGSLFIVSLRCLEISELVVWVSFLFLIASDFALRYQDLGNIVSAIPIFEYGWEFALAASLCAICKLWEREKHKKLSNPAPLYSIRVIAPSLSLVALLAFVIASLSITSYLKFTTGATIGSYVMVFMVIWALANFLSIGLSKFLSRQVQELSRAIFAFTSPQEGNSLHGLLEMTPSISLLEHVKEQLSDSIRKNSFLEADAKLGKLASQVAHDIRSPLTALDIAMEEARGLPEENRVLIRSATKRIKDITNSLLKMRAHEHGLANSNSSVESELLYPLIDEVVSEKRVQIRAKSHIEIDFECEKSASVAFSLINGAAFKRAISNIVENSIEATRDGGKILINLSLQNLSCIITIVDSGNGMPSHCLSLVAKEGFTFNKVDGNGLGLTFADDFARKFGGSLRISSEQGIGTRVFLELPIADAPTWFCTELVNFGECVVVVLDDDISIHQLWDRRFESSDMGMKHFYDVDQFYEWQSKASKTGNKIFLVDYEFQNNTRTGLDLIRSLGLESQSILVTSHYEDKSLRLLCSDAKIKMLPKSLAGLVPVRVARTGFTNSVRLN